jgi:hypothetical protein
MKRSQEKHTVQKQVTAIKRKVMEVTQRLHLVHDEPCMIFEEIKGQGSQLDQLVVTPRRVIQVDIGGHPPFPNGSKQFSVHFGNLLFLAGFNFWGHFEGPNEGF